ncbi:tRNA (adenine(58)-N(1))-methyltransferase catalytic subunit TRMT61A [Musca domestica]|uniref:tRNA (adenine(58)-N(1))-methyltransferase catalytic subunit TRMT61A n=1 Tax=Musca domestica TaxID=7370 RepID=A0ABM3VFH0_MUSDO|nr:tRNA (adenine(58)-N(1))-methyltransferase catalytic subunit TRMT61A [Musca domestica]XP_058984543.1 tRNA (adenine(58)-N(1))-methyltransferase catalytic subunit TRMT61A [Musca domestica]
MSFLKPKDVIDEGDTVILYISVNSMHVIEATPTIVNKKGETIEHIFQTSFGALKVRNIIGVKYGSRVELSKGYAYVLLPNPELWTQTLPHRTQIIYTPDISMILHQLEVRPGSIVIESGTGSGSLSHYFLRAVKPHGHLHTFDFHEARANQARDEFKHHGLGDFVTVYHRDVCENGFGEELNGKADAVFLDLPAPQLAVPHAYKALKDSGGRFCSFSPCIEQSQRCCAALQELGFTEIQSYEILQQEDVVKTKTFPVMNLEFLKTEKDTSSSTKQPKETMKILTSSAPPTQPGHTGFLTFATLQPAFLR